MKIIKINGNDCGGFQKPRGHLDTQMFPECEGTETDRNIVQKTIKRRNKKRKKHASKVTWPLVTHDAMGIYERWKRGVVSDKDFVKKMALLSEISGFPGVPDDPLIRDIINTSLLLYRSDGDDRTAAHNMGHAFSAWMSMEREVSQAEASFNLREYRLSSRNRMRDNGGNIIEGPDMNEITPSYLKMIKMYLEEKHPNIIWTMEKIATWINENLVGKAAPFDKPQDLYRGD